MNPTELLQRVPWFVGLRESHYAHLAANLGTQSFQRGETIFHQGDLGNSLYIITKGQVRIYTVAENGQELSVRIFREGDFFGELALLDGQPRSASAAAMCPTSVLTLHRGAFLHVLEACPPIAVAILEALSGRLRQTNRSAEHLASTSATQRVVHQLVQLADQYGVARDDAIFIDLRLTQDDLASLSGTTRETVNRVLSHLRDQRLIRVERAQVSVL